MKYYYYKGDEKIGPVGYDETLLLAKWEDITPYTVIETDDGRQVSASDALPPTCTWGGTDHLGMSLSAARQRVALCGYVKVFGLLGMAASCIVMVPAGHCGNSRLLNWCLAVLFAFAGFVTWDGYYAAVKKLDKVPPKRMPADIQGTLF